MQRQVLLVDMDGVLADTYPQFLDYHFRKHGVRLEAAQIVGKLEGEAFPDQNEFCNHERFFLDARPIPGSAEALERLNAAYDLFIVSSATEFPASLAQKQAWLGIHYPFVSWWQMIFCGDKRLIRGDVMIDDHFKNLDGFAGQTLLFTQPHNQLRDPGRHTRVHTWADVAARLL